MAAIDNAVGICRKRTLRAECPPDRVQRIGALHRPCFELVNLLQSCNLDLLQTSNLSAQPCGVKPAAVGAVNY
jgi:hypothetical protein